MRKRRIIEEEKKSGQRPVPNKNKKCLQKLGYGSIILKIIFWASYTIKKIPIQGHPTGHVTL